MIFVIAISIIAALVFIGILMGRNSEENYTEEILTVEETTPMPEPEEPVAVEMPHIEPAPTQKPAAKSRSRKKKAEYNPNAVDRDKDGLVQDGTPFERPAEPKPASNKRRGRPKKKA